MKEIVARVMDADMAKGAVAAGLTLLSWLANFNAIIQALIGVASLFFLVLKIVQITLEIFKEKRAQRPFFHVIRPRRPPSGTRPNRL